MRQNKIYPYLILFLFSAMVFVACQKDYNEPANQGDGFYGPRIGVAITQIILDTFPEFDPGNNTWDTPDTIDVAGRPDIFYSIHDEPDTSGYPGYIQPFQFENVNNDSLPLPYFLTTEYKVKEFGSNILLEIYDYEKDPASSEVDSTLMKSFVFSIAPGDSLVGNPYPNALSLTQDGYSVRVVLDWIKKEE